MNPLYHKRVFWYTSRYFWIILMLIWSFGCKRFQQKQSSTELSAVTYQKLYDVTQSNSYGNCKTANLEEMFQGDIIHVVLCYADLQELQTSAAIGGFVDPKDGWFAIVFRGDQMRDYILVDDAEWIDMRIDKGEIDERIWFGEQDWEWVYNQNKLDYFDNFLDGLSAGNRLLVRNSAHGRTDDVDEDTRYDAINLNGAQAAISDFRSRIQGLRGAMEANDKNTWKKDDYMQKIISQFNHLK